MGQQVQLVDLNTCAIGAVTIARGTRATFASNVTKVTSQTNGRAKRIDGVYAAPTARIEAEDPLSLPSVLALAAGETVKAGGRVASSAPAAYSDVSLLNCVLTGFGLNIRDNAPGTCSYDFQNRAPYGSTLPQQLLMAAGARQGRIAREGIIRILSAEFEDDASETLPLPGFLGINLNARVQGVSVACTPGGVIADLVDLTDGWDGGGGVNLGDSSISATQALASQLAAMRRGTLTLSCQVSGQASGAAAPANKLVYFHRLKFWPPSASLQAGPNPAGWDLEFDWEMVDAAGVELDLTDMVEME